MIERQVVIGSFDKHDKVQEASILSRSSAEQDVELMMTVRNKEQRVPYLVGQCSYAYGICRSMLILQRKSRKKYAISEE